MKMMTCVYPASFHASAVRLHLYCSSVFGFPPQDLCLYFMFPLRLMFVLHVHALTSEGREYDCKGLFSNYHFLRIHYFPRDTFRNSKPKLSYCTTAVFFINSRPTCEGRGLTYVDIYDYWNCVVAEPWCIGPHAATSSHAQYLFHTQYPHG
jgi:hypothetical protein